MLPDNLFVNLIDTNLQRRIVNCTTTDKDAAEALITLLKDDPTTMKNQTDNWILEPFEGKHALFYKNKNYIPPDDELRRDIAAMFHDHEKQQDILVNSKHTMPSDNTTGGQVSAPT